MTSCLSNEASRVLLGKSNVHVTRETGEVDEGLKEKASADPGEKVNDQCFCPIKLFSAVLGKFHFFFMIEAI